MKKATEEKSQSLHVRGERDKIDICSPK
jgi:hypothetical protein